MIKRFIFILTLLLGSWSSASAKQYTTWGTDFWLAFLPNWHDYDVDHYTFAASAKRNCTVTVTNPHNGWTKTFSVNGGSTATLAIPTAESSQCWEAGSCVVTNKGLHITATDSIQFYAYNYSGSPSTCDASLIYPTEMLGDYYVLHTYPISCTAKTDVHCAFSILAVEDNTTIDISLVGNTSTNIASGTEYSITLQAGQVYQVLSPTYSGNFSGTTLMSHGCKPFALFYGATATSIPTGNEISTDHLFQQDLSPYYWGREWVLMPAELHNQDYVRVTASADSCQVRLNGNLIATLNMYQSHEFCLTQPAVLTTTQPAAVDQYYSSRHNTQQGGDFGDAYLLAVPPTSVTNRAVSTPRFEVNSRSGLASQYFANVVVLTAETSLFRLDGRNVSSSFSPISGTRYSYARLSNINNGSTLTTTGSGFHAYTYGLGENWEAYVISLGGADTTLYDTRSSSQYTFDFSTCDSIVQWRGSTYRQSGKYTDTLHMSNGCDSILQLDLHIHPTYHFDIDTQVCGESFTFGDSTYTTSGIHNINQTSSLGCDSSYHINLEFHPEYTTAFDTSTCLDTLTWHGTDYAVPGNYMITFHTTHGCDSVVYLNLIQEYGYDTTYYAVINDTQSYTWINGVTYHEDIDTLIRLTDINNCDSILRLVLQVYPIDRMCKIWIPNVFTPSNSDNNTFRISTQYIDQLTVSIYQRWGDHVVTYDGLTQSWDGTKDGIPCPQAAYVYIIHYHVTNSNETPTPIIGTITLIR